MKLEHVRSFEMTPFINRNFQRFGIGLFLLVFGTVGSAWAQTADATKLESPRYFYGKVASRGPYDRPEVYSQIEVLRADVVRFRYRNSAETVKRGLVPITDPKAFLVSEGETTIGIAKILGQVSMLANLEHIPNQWQNPVYETLTTVQLATPMVAGKTYEFKLDDNQSGTAINTRLIWDPNRSVSSAFKVNQLGYHPNGKVRLAYFGRWLGEVASLDGAPKTVDVVDCHTGKVVLTPTADLRHSAGEKNETPYKMDLSGENVHAFNLSLLKPGDYYLCAPSIGRSWSFHVGPSAMAEALFTTTRQLFHNRCGVELTKTHTPWVRSNCRCHRRLAVMPEYDSDERGFQTGFKEIKTFLDAGKTSGDLKWVDGVSGGHHDAADYDRSPPHLKIPDMLAIAYELNPTAFIDNQFGIPESGNGIPDLLDEALFSLKFAQSQQWDDGGIPSGTESWEHPVNELHLATGAEPNPLRTTVDNETLEYCVLPVTPESCYLYATSAAHVGNLLLELDAGSSQGAELLVSATRAFRCAWQRWPISDEKTDILATTALARLLTATGEPGFLKMINTLGVPTGRTKLDFLDGDSLRCADAFCSIPSELLDEQGRARQQRMAHAVGQAIDQAATAHIDTLGYIHYRHPWAPSGFGTASVTMAWHPAIAWKLTGHQRFFDLLSSSADSVLGANPMGQVQCSGLGQRHINQPMHLPSMNDALEEPVPGIWVYGPRKAIDGWIADLYPPIPAADKVPDLYRHLDIDEIPAMSEFTIHESTVSAIVLFAALAPEKPPVFQGPLPNPR